MKEKTDKILTLALLGLAIIATVFAFVFALNTVNNSGMFDIAFWLLIIMIGFSLLAIVVFLCKKLIERFKSEKGYLTKFLLLIALIAILLVVSFVLAKGGDVDIVKYGISEGASKLIGAACILVYIIVIGAALSILVTEVMPKTRKSKNYGKKNTWLKHQFNVRHLVPVVGLLPIGLQHQHRSGYCTSFAASATRKSGET